MDNIEVTFKAIKVEAGTGPLDIRVLVPKGEYLLVAEDSGYYYLQPVRAMLSHAEAPKQESN